MPRGWGREGFRGEGVEWGVRRMETGDEVKRNPAKRDRGVRVGRSRGKNRLDGCNGFFVIHYTK